MSQTQSTDEAPAASLVGSLGIFTLSDVLSLLAGTGQTGELQVVGSGIDGRVWLDGGELSNAHVGAATTIGQAVFELACVSEGWFYFTAGLVSSSGQPKVPVAAVLDEVRPQVNEWRELRTVVPLDAVVSLSPHPPGDDVQIRGAQWKTLTTIGNDGQTVRAVLDAIGGDQISGLRNLRDLLVAGLIMLDGLGGDDGSQLSARAGSGGTEGSHGLPSDLPLTSGNDGGAVGIQDDQTTPSAGDMAEVTVMPPPIGGDPWMPSSESEGSENNGVA